MEEDFTKFKHIKAWLDTGRQEDASERRTNDRIRNIDVKGWYKKAEVRESRKEKVVRALFWRP